MVSAAHRYQALAGSNFIANFCTHNSDFQQPRAGCHMVCCEFCLRSRNQSAPRPLLITSLTVMLTVSFYLSFFVCSRIKRNSDITERTYLRHHVGSRIQNASCRIVLEVQVMCPAAPARSSGTDAQQGQICFTYASADLCVYG